MATSLSDLVTQRRIELNLTLAELSKQCGVAVSTLSSIEHACRKMLTPATLRGLATGLKLHPIDVLIASGYLSYDDEPIATANDDVAPPADATTPDPT